MAYANGYTANDPTLASAAAINAGMDMNSNTISPFHLGLALQRNLTSVATIFATAGRVLAQRIRLGQLDPLESQPAGLLALGPGALGGANNDVAAEGVLQGSVLLRNNNKTLPLRYGLPCSLFALIIIVIVQHNCNNNKKKNSNNIIMLLSLMLFSLVLSLSSYCFSRLAVELTNVIPHVLRSSLM